MTVQLPLPGVVWPRNASWPDPAERLQQLEQDKVEAKFEMRQVLDKYAEKYGIRPKDVNELVWSYADDLIGNLFYETEEALRQEIDADIERENQQP